MTQGRLVAAFLLSGLFMSISAEAPMGQQSFIPPITAAPTRTPTPPPPPTLTPTPFPIFSAIVEVAPSKYQMAVNDILDVKVSIHVSRGCQYPIYELTLTQAGDKAPLFAYLSPITQTVMGVSNPFTYTLKAISPGTITFHALAYGERNCGDGWLWTYVGGASLPVTILPQENRVYLPIIWKE